MGFLFMKNCLKVVFVIIGTLIGAGFASGQEVYLFFYSYGIKGMQNYHCIISAENLGLLMHIRLKNLKIKDDKILAYFRKECNGHKALNHKFKIIITEICKNKSLFQIEYLVPANLNGYEIDLIKSWLNYILKKIKKYLLISANNEQNI
jgi:hypothetical protein